MKTTVFIIIFILIATIAIYFYNKSLIYDVAFCKKKWMEDREHRYVLVKRIVKEKLLIGLTKKEIVTLLGDEFNGTYTLKWTYYIGEKPGILRWTKQQLCILFTKEGKVYKVFEG